MLGSPVSLPVVSEDDLSGSDLLTALPLSGVDALAARPLPMTAEDEPEEPPAPRSRVRRDTATADLFADEGEA